MIHVYTHSNGVGWSSREFRRRCRKPLNKKRFSTTPFPIEQLQVIQYLIFLRINNVVADMPTAICSVSGNAPYALDLLIFGTPKDHRKTKPYYDHVFVFSIVDGHIWFRNYQVLSWKNERGELIFTSSKAIFKPPTPVRGGIPICFPQALQCIPQFGNRGSLEQHGFARNKIWVFDESPHPLQPSDSNGKAYVDLLFKPTEEDLKVWPHSYEFLLRVSLAYDGSLSLISRVRNINCKPFSFSFAYRTYFSVSDISEVRVEGVETLDYLDNLRNRERFTEQGDALTFESEVCQLLN